MKKISNTENNSAKEFQLSLIKWLIMLNNSTGGTRRCQTIEEVNKKETQK